MFVIVVVDLMIQCNMSLTTLLLELRVDLQTLLSTLLTYNTHHHEGDVLFWSTVPRVVKKKVAVVDEDSGGL